MTSEGFLGFGVISGKSAISSQDPLLAPKLSWFQVVYDLGDRHVFAGDGRIIDVVFSLVIPSQPSQYTHICLSQCCLF
jgi:hypothetical protein